MDSAPSNATASDVSEEVLEDSTGSSSTDESEISWIEWYCQLDGHDYFVRVDEQYIEDGFNLTGLNAVVPYYAEALDMILDIAQEETYSKAEMDSIEASAEKLYMLIHQRFILTKLGQQLLMDNIESEIYGYCPRVFCQNQALLPVGLEENLGKCAVKLFCPRCIDLYTPPDVNHEVLDGAAFGRTASHFLALINPEKFVPDNQSIDTVYVPQIFGFKLHKSSKFSQRMEWLRQRQV